MKIAILLNGHSDERLIRDTLESIFTYVSQNVLLMIDGIEWDRFQDLVIAAKLCGFRHGAAKSPYRNVALGLQLLTARWPDADWYCYAEEDVLFTSTRFQADLKMAVDRDVWMLGNDGRVDEVEMPLIESLIGEKFRSVYYLLGCCQFFNRKFMNKLKEIDFFSRFLFLTNNFSDGFFPSYQGYDISEHLYPTLCRHFGGNVGVFATWDNGDWHGAFEYFPMRWKPELDPEQEGFPHASIMHPLKTYDHPLREFHRERREVWNTTHRVAELSDLS